MHKDIEFIVQTSLKMLSGSLTLEEARKVDAILHKNSIIPGVPDELRTIYREELIKLELIKAVKDKASELGFEVEDLEAVIRLDEDAIAIHNFRKFRDKKSKLPNGLGEDLKKELKRMIVDSTTFEDEDEDEDRDFIELSLGDRVVLSEEYLQSYLHDYETKEQVDLSEIDNNSLFGKVAIVVEIDQNFTYNCGHCSKLHSSDIVVRFIENGKVYHADSSNFTVLSSKTI